MKRRIAMIIVAVLLCVSIATVLVACNDEDSVSIYGKYWLANADGSLSQSDYIELNEDSSYAFSDGTLGTYEVNGNNISFLVNGIDEYDGVYSDGVIVVTKRGAQYGVFAKSGATVDPDLLTGGALTVTLNTNGGSAIDPIQVQYGSVINGLKTPSKSGYIFDGWYKDANCTQPWNILTDTVTRSLTLYAKWSDVGAIVGIDNVKNEGDNFFVVVDEDTDRILLENAVQIKGDATWKLFYDVYGTQEITTKIATGPDGSLANGANEFYIITYVGDPENPITHTYFLTVYKQYEVNVVFAVADLPGGTVIPAYSFEMLSGQPIPAEQRPTQDMFPGITISDWRLEDHRPTEEEEGFDEFEPTIWDFSDDIVEGDLVLYAEYTAKDFTAHLDANGGHVSQATAPVTFLNEYQLPVPTLEGYTFDGWYFNNERFTDSEGKNVEAGLAIGVGYSPSVNGWPLPFDEKLEAYWTVNNGNAYTTRVLVNNVYAGTVSGAGNYDYGEEVTLSAYTNPGYTWVGWYDRNGLVSTDAEYKFSATGDNEIYTAKFAKLTLENLDSYDSVNGGTPSYDQTISYAVGDTVTLTATHANSGIGYTFAGWYNEDGEKVHGGIEYEVQLTAEDVTYYAKWIDCPITVTNDDGGAGNITQLAYTVLGEYTTVVAEPYNNSVFLGWYIGGMKVNSPLIYTFEITTSNLEITAMWDRPSTLPIKVTKNLSGAGNVSIVGNSFNEGSSVTLHAENNEGYLFTGWYVGEDLVSASLDYKLTVTADTSSTTYEARWVSSPINVTNSDYYAGSVMTVGSWVVGEDLTIVAVPNADYTFIGWYKDLDTTPISKQLEYTFKATNEDVTYEARWVNRSVTVNLNDTLAGVVEPIDTTVAGVKQMLVAQTNPGYAWNGWYYYVDGGDGDILRSMDLEYEITVSEQHVTYIAKWIELPEVSINMVGAGIIEMKNAEVVGNQVTLSAQTNMGYKFVGWFDVDDLENPLTTSENYSFELTEIAAVEEYVAVFRHVELTLVAEEGGALLGGFTVTVDFNQGDLVEPVEQLVMLGSQVVYPAIPSNQGAFFTGWYVDQDCTTLYDFSQDIVSDVTVYAGWEHHYGNVMPINQPLEVTAYDKTNGMVEYYAFYAYQDCSVTLSAEGSDTTQLDIYILDSQYGILAENSGSAYYYQLSTSSYNVLAGRIYYVRVCSRGADVNAQITLSMNVNVDCGYCVEPKRVSTTTQEVAMGTYAPISVEVQEGYKFVGWYLGNMTISLDNNFNYFMLEEDTTLTAKFERIEDAE